MTRRTFISSLLALFARTKLCVLEKFAPKPPIYPYYAGIGILGAPELGEAMKVHKPFTDQEIRAIVQMLKIGRAINRGQQVVKP